MPKTPLTPPRSRSSPMSRQSPGSGASTPTRGRAASPSPTRAGATSPSPPGSAASSSLARGSAPSSSPGRGSAACPSPDRVSASSSSPARASAACPSPGRVSASSSSPGRGSAASTSPGRGSAASTSLLWGSFASPSPTRRAFGGLGLDGSSSSTRSSTAGQQDSSSQESWWIASETRTRPSSSGQEPWGSASGTRTSASSSGQGCQNELTGQETEWWKQALSRYMSSPPSSHSTSWRNLSGPLRSDSTLHGQTSWRNWSGPLSSDSVTSSMQLQSPPQSQSSPTTQVQSQSVSMSQSRSSSTTMPPQTVSQFTVSSLSAPSQTVGSQALSGASLASASTRPSGTRRRASPSSARFWSQDHVSRYTQYIKKGTTLAKDEKVHTSTLKTVFGIPKQGSAEFVKSIIGQDLEISNSGGRTYMGEDNELYPVNGFIKGIAMKSYHEIAQRFVKLLLMSATEREQDFGVRPGFNFVAKLNVPSRDIATLYLLMTKKSKKLLLSARLAKENDQKVAYAGTSVTLSSYPNIVDVVKAGHGAGTLNIATTTVLAEGVHPSLPKGQDLYVLENVEEEESKFYRRDVGLPSPKMLSFSYNYRPNYDVMRLPMRSGGSLIHSPLQSPTVYDTESASILEATVNHGLVSLRGSFSSVNAISYRPDMPSLSVDYTQVDGNLSDFLGAYGERFA